MRNALILGCGRSGTSLTTGLLHAAGYHCGANPMHPRDANPAGFYEDHLVNYANELIMRQVVRVSRLAPWFRRLTGRPPHREGQLWLIALDHAVDWSPIMPAPWIMAELAARQPFAYKDPRFSYTLDAWRPYVGECAFVCLFRDPAVVARSIVNDVATEPYYANLSITSRDAIDIWTTMYRRILETHYDRTSSWIFIEYDELVSGDALPALGRFLDCPLNADSLDPSLNRSTAADIVIAEPTRTLYSQLKVLAQQTQTAAMTGSASHAT